MFLSYRIPNTLVLVFLIILSVLFVHQFLNYVCVVTRLPVAYLTTAFGGLFLVALASLFLNVFMFLWISIVTSFIVLKHFSFSQSFTQSITIVYRSHSAYHRPLSPGSNESFHWTPMNTFQLNHLLLLLLWY